MEKIGDDDIVRLSSGGPEMKVLGNESEGYVKCEWINKRGDDMAGSFPIQLLKKLRR